MAVGAPVLERRSATEERTSRIFNAEYRLTDEEHNARIGQNYARLINPENKIDEALDRAPAKAEAPATPVQEVSNAPVLVENARADADIFNAHSEMNQRLAAQRQIVAEQSSDDEESEDLRPTQTTIQYRTSALTTTFENGKVKNVSVEKRVGFTKRDKIIIAAIVSVILVMLVLIIVNAAILANLNSDVSYLQSSLTTMKGSYEGVKDQIGMNTLTEEQIADLAKQLGWIKG
ncbi:MAG: hypothetical protein J1G05_03555 [Clostridiales bacterium]|nr:hypothetical protein [Clostridiales bacterium]